jgi:hypothetical protein
MTCGGSSKHLPHHGLKITGIGPEDWSWMVELDKSNSRYALDVATNMAKTTSPKQVALFRAPVQVTRKSPGRHSKLSKSNIDNRSGTGSRLLPL